jgi:hypothetical protein
MIAASTLQAHQINPYDEVAMTIKTKSLSRLLVLSTLCAAGIGFLPVASAQSASSSTSASKSDLKPGVLDRTEATAILPKTVFYKGLSATIQGRNSAGIRFGNGDLVLVTMVDTSGYSSAVTQTYQAYLLNEVHLKIGDKVLPPGAYGFGFIGGDHMVVMDIAGNELLRATTTRDPQLARPDPLHIVADEAMPGHYRLYLGRSYITLSAEK